MTPPAGRTIWSPSGGWGAVVTTGAVPGGVVVVVVVDRGFAVDVVAARVVLVEMAVVGVSSGMIAPPGAVVVTVGSGAVLVLVAVSPVPAVATRIGWSEAAWPVGAPPWPRARATPL